MADRGGYYLNKNIFAIIIIIVLSSSVLTPITIGQNIQIINGEEYQPLNSNKVNLPEWFIGHFWEYNLSIILKFGSMRLVIDVTRMDLKVTDINEYNDEYHLNLSGYINRIEYCGLQIPIKATYLSGNAHINKSTLAMKDFKIVLSGNSQGLLNIDFNIIMKMVFDPDFDFFGFPIIIEEPWNITTNADFTFNSNVKVNGQDKPFKYEIEDRMINDKLSVIKNESLTVPAGDFESYLISGGLGEHSELWFSPEVGYLVKVDEVITRFLNIIKFDCYLELLSTNFNYPKNNSAPNITNISGPISGEAGVKYEYMISTTDPEGEQVYYKIDWGDRICSNWLGPYNSGDEVIVNHTWMDKAIYKIRVKAKDENGYQTTWSDSFIVTMPRNKMISNSLVLKFLDGLPILERLLTFKGRSLSFNYGI